ncbi:HPr family phosphocarrier protein [Ammoniphilus sp. YIM 78166]|uniref:HPr family phosphocarrier protein n=1 Tax=Ammoniphilus sp. YIM 78166 TaxID=1644106 RepID=UPI00107036C0|nr:HPr family phosphocarrier protein [Ammoniphilus sp. YIM 78166]
MIQKEITVNLKQGLHARPATRFVKQAAAFGSQIQIIKKDQKADAKSILGIMSMAVSRGETITLTADGEDEQEAIKALEQILLEEE